ncbi:hypothetical protein DFH07DRAFT_814596 [Mycena maculata]|uniref:Uncharacterized protein n=1 Tax=Mycena maculata TaxID=230809 RepID=A0AAD7NIW9_9AGAR|nr:hypothetical protein DFH07DRAFT_814596 [Mycena maculata]
MVFMLSFAVQGGLRRFAPAMVGGEPKRKLRSLRLHRHFLRVLFSMLILHICFADTNLMNLVLLSEPACLCVPPYTHLVSFQTGRSTHRATCQCRLLLR